MGRESETILVEGSFIIPLDGTRRVIRDGAVLVEGDRISAVGGLDEVKRKASRVDRRVGGRGYVIIPGLIDLHVHLAQAMLRGIVPDDIQLIPWLRDWVWPLQGSYDADDGRTSAQLCILEMLKTGTTCFLESLLHTRYGFDGIAEAVLSSGIRGVLSKSVMDIAGYAGEQGIMHPGMVEDRESSLGEYKSMHKKWNGAEGRLDVWIGLRTPGAVSDELCREAASLAREQGSGITMHLAEVREDLEYFKSVGSTPSKFLADRGLLGKKRVYVHCVWLSNDDIRVFAETGTAVAHCPSSNLKLSSGIAPVSDMLRAGVTVGLGCDGGPSNDTYDMLREVKLAAILQKGRTLDPTSMSAWDALEMATVHGAKALGKHRDLGSLEPGKKADLVVVSFDRPGLRPITDPISTLVYAASGCDVRYVMVDGTLVVEDGRVVTMDEEAVVEEAQRRAEKLLARTGLEEKLRARFEA